MDLDIESHRGTIYDLLRTIKDPEKPGTLEDLEIVYEDGIKVESHLDSDHYLVEIQYNVEAAWNLFHIKGLIEIHDDVDAAFLPTIPHCSLATLIGLCMRVKLERNLPTNHKISIFVAEGTHNTRDEINKQINDKERTSAAMENPNIMRVVEKCIQEPN